MNELSRKQQRDSAALRARLQRVFNLTSAESHLAVALVQGMSLKAYAAVAGIAEGTARIHLKRVFAKTGTHRQAELVALIWRLSEGPPAQR